MGAVIMVVSVCVQGNWGISFIDKFNIIIRPSSII